ncbi:MAG: dienelactone hydrolase family protein [Bryobacteraceae bacterium]
MRFLAVLPILAACAAAAEPKTVHFPSEDGRTNLTGYLFEPAGTGAGTGTGTVPHAAIVMLHGRAGPYSSLAKGIYTAATLSQRHRQWGEFWAARGYLALLVDSFGPRGYPGGFPVGSYEQRPDEVSEQTVRPLDAYGALRYLRGRGDAISNRVGVQGWSNGAMTVLVTMSSRAPGIERPTPLTGFRAALAEYPGCGMAAIQGSYRAYAPILMMIAGADEEVSPQRCQEFAQRARAAGNPLEAIVYAGAEHNFDDPGNARQSKAANRRATEDAMRRAEEFFAAQLLR